MAKKKKAQDQGKVRLLWARLLAWAQADPVAAAIWAAGGVLALAAVVLYVARLIPQNLSGEAFYDFQYPYRNEFLESTRLFFFERIRSRLLHGLFISGLYSMIGFNPPALYLIMLLMLIATAVVITFVLKPFIRSPWLASLLAVTFTLLPLNIVDLMALKKAHHVLAWFLFWLAVLLFQRWVAGKRLPWLFGAAAAFLASVLSYEATIALLPVAVFLSVHDLHGWKDWLNKFAMTLWITLLSAFAFLNLEALKPYSGIGEVYSADLFSPSHILAAAAQQLPRIPLALWNGTLFSEMEFSALGLFALRLFVVAAVAGFVFVIWRGVAQRDRRHAKGTAAGLPLALAGAWLTFANYAPFLIAGQAPDGDSLRGAAFGLIFFALAAATLLDEQPRQLRVGAGALAAVCVFWIAAGGVAYGQQLTDSRQEEAVLHNFVISLKAQVPDVALGTVFVFVNNGFGRTGDIGMLNMLYDHSDLHVIHLIDGDLEETYTRVDGGMLETGGRLFPDHFVILTFDEAGNVTILNELTAEQFPESPITWQETTPLRTDPRLILSQAQGRNLDFYKYVLQQP